MLHGIVKQTEASNARVNFSQTSLSLSDLYRGTLFFLEYRSGLGLLEAVLVSCLTAKLRDEYTIKLREMGGDGTRGERGGWATPVPERHLELTGG